MEQNINCNASFLACSSFYRVYWKCQNVVKEFSKNKLRENKFKHVELCKWEKEEHINCLAMSFRRKMLLVIDVDIDVVVAVVVVVVVVVIGNQTHY